MLKTLMEKLTQEKFVQKAELKHKNKYDYSNTKYTGSSKKVEVICPIHGTFFQIAGDHLKGHGCYKCGRDICADKYRFSQELFIEKLKVKYEDKFDYSLIKYSGMHKKVIVICKKHNRKIKTLAQVLLLNTFTCPQCKGSRGELKIAHLLDKYSIEYEQQQIFDWCKNSLTNKHLRFDFYLPSYNLCIEFDGLYHYKPLTGEKELLSSKFRDNIKTVCCENQGVTLLRIPYWKYEEIETILKKQLNINK